MFQQRPQYLAGCTLLALLLGASAVRVPATSSGAERNLLQFVDQVVPHLRSCATGHALYPGEYGKESVERLADFTSKILQEIVGSFHNTDAFDYEGASGGFKRFNPFSPAIHCPPPNPDPIKYADLGWDGGKKLCDVSQFSPEALSLAGSPLSGTSPPCLVYVLGGGWDKSFEQDMLNKTACAVHTFDCNVEEGSVDSNNRHFFHNWCIRTAANKPSTDSGKYFTFVEAMEELGHLGHGKPRLAVLRMDLEGYEAEALASLAQLPPHRLPSQIWVEFHLSSRTEDGTVAGPAAPKNIRDLGLLFYHLASLGYGPVARNDNEGSGGCCSQYTFLRVQAVPGERELHHQRARVMHT